MLAFSSLPVPDCGVHVNLLDFISVLKQRTEVSASNLTTLKRQITRLYSQGPTENISQMISNGLSFMDTELSETIRFMFMLQNYSLEKKLAQWKREQQLGANGCSHNMSIDVIQKLYEGLAEVVWKTREQTKEFKVMKEAVNMAPSGDDLFERVTQLLSALVTSTLIIEKQPIQVIKTKTRFSASVRFLIGNKLPITSPKVNITLISESQANSLLRKEPLKPQDSPGQLVNNSGTMDYSLVTSSYSANFKQMQVTGIKRTSEKKGVEFVMEEKCCLYVQSEFTLGNGELMFTVWTLSVPVVVIVHGSQEAGAWGTITWDNAFGKTERYPFEVPDVVTWKEMASTLSTKFKSATGKELSRDDLQYLGGKLFKTNEFNDFTPVNWNQLSKEHLPNKKFTFWEWFFGVMKLIKEHLSDLWKDGTIIGFIRKEDAEEKLQDCLPGTFLLRFSDSELGGITIAWRHADGHVYSLEPFTSKDFTTRSLPDRISDLNNLIYLYPYNLHKDIHFGNYYTPPEDFQTTKRNGYVKLVLVTQIEGMKWLCKTCLGYIKSGNKSPEVNSIISQCCGNDNSVRSTENISPESLDRLSTSMDYYEDSPIPYFSVSE